MCTKLHGKNLYYKAQFCLCVGFISSKTARGTSIKRGTIDHHFVVSVIRVLVTFDDVINKIFVLELALLDTGQPLFA